MSDTRFINLRSVARETGVPAAWLKREAEAGRVPVIHVGRRILADPQQVALSLSQRAEQTIDPEGRRDG